MTAPIKIPLPDLAGPCRDRRDIEWVPHRGESSGPAVAVCGTCPADISRACARYALDTDAAGVYAGVVVPLTRQARSHAHAMLARIAGIDTTTSAPTPDTTIRAVTTSAASRRKAARITAVSQLYREGLTNSEIAEKLGMTKKQVANYLHEYRRLTGQVGTYRKKNR
ncbi:helix-turn-helix domain-containing protein [Gordonia sp. PP30]|uniref:helix-turn-helix domain-containing protein n=1 Tax=Gordonia sp. PP30 TaxID=2935861 RepID=UPI0020002405|nr:helix-turn-helix domain-containing protein [Gordonia sp. PP30]UQE74217.1 helix-turn-helix domain-containing protein [Gordonia sp. PP30]